MSKDIQVVLEKAREEMIFLGPDHPYYGLLAALVTSVRKAWQEGHDSASGGPAENPYGYRSIAPSEHHRRRPPLPPTHPK